MEAGGWWRAITTTTSWTCTRAQPSTPWIGKTQARLVLPSSAQVSAKAELTWLFFVVFPCSVHPWDRTLMSVRNSSENSLGFQTVCVVWVDLGFLMIWSLTYAVGVNDLWSLYLQVNHSKPCSQIAKSNKITQLGVIDFISWSPYPQLFAYFLWWWK